MDFLASAAPKQTTNSSDVTATAALSPYRKPTSLSFSTVGWAMRASPVYSVISLDPRGNRLMVLGIFIRSTFDDHRACSPQGSRLRSLGFRSGSLGRLGLGRFGLGRFGLGRLGLGRLGLGRLGLGRLLRGGFRL